MKSNIICLGFLIFTLALGYQCQSPSILSNVPVQFDPQQVPYSLLSEYAFFRGHLPEQQPNEAVLPYAPITPLFTDYAHKARFVWMPDSVQASAAMDGRILFPDNTVLIKSFYYPADFRLPKEDWKMIETRLLVKKQGRWEAYTYLWNEEGSDAELNLVGDIQSVEWTDKRGIARSADYVVPNKNQCKSCHNRNKELFPIGPRVQHLISPYEYYSLATSNQVQLWQDKGILESGDWTTQFTPTPNWSEPDDASLEKRALAYLDINCGHCHHPQGPAHTTGLYLGLEFMEKRAQLGFCKPPVAAGKGSGGHRYSIVPGKPDSSILVYRMASNDPGIMMPELGRGIVHEEGLALIKEWISSLDGSCN